MELLFSSGLRVTCTDISHLSSVTDATGAAQLPKTTQVVFEIQSGRSVPRLCEPRHLYGVSGHVSQTHSRWPKECVVIQEDIHHIGERTKMSHVRYL